MVATNKWQTITEFEVDEGVYPVSCTIIVTHTQQRTWICFHTTAGVIFFFFDVIAIIEILSSEFLIHAADVEGLCQGIDEALVQSEPLLKLIGIHYSE